MTIMEESSNSPQSDIPTNEANQLTKISWKSNDPDLRYKFWQLIALYSNLIVAVIGVIAVVSSINNNTKSLDNSSRALRANVQNNVLTHVTSLDKLFIEKPYLYPYFYEGKEPDPKNEHYQEIIAAAQFYTDVLDVVNVQTTRFRDEWEDPDAWDKWIIDMFKRSPVLRTYLIEHREWYSKGFKGKFERAQQELGEK